jgi:hypothetical protein
MNIIVRLPSDDTICTIVHPSMTCEDLCATISRDFSVISGRMFLLYDGNILAPGCIISQSIPEESIVEVLMKCDKMPELFYDENSISRYISSVTPVDNSKGVNVSCQPCISFTEYNGSALNLPSMIESSKNNSLNDGDIVKTLGIDEAQKNGFVKWYNEELKENIFLLEVTDPRLKQNIDMIKYKPIYINGKFYTGGDKYSWQRYTSKPPIPCFIHLDEMENCVKLIPENSLSLSTTYVICILNNIPNPPLSLEASLFQYHGAGTCDDFVSFFTTASSHARRKSNLFGSS